MKPAIKLYLRVFLLTGVPFGILMTVFDLIFGHGFSVGAFLWPTLIFGTSMSVIFVTAHIASLKKIGVRELNDENLRTKQFRNVKSNLTKEELVARLKNDANFKDLVIHEIEGGITFKTGTSWNSWGETIDLNFTHSKNNRDMIRVASRPSLGTALVDSGRNVQNVNRIEDLILGVA